jgi:cytochrome c oxidase assembly protein subunit 15
VAWLSVREGGTRALRAGGLILAVVLAAQLVLGPAMVLLALPLSLATAHNAVAALLLLAVVAVLRYSRAPAAARNGR